MCFERRKGWIKSAWNKSLSFFRQRCQPLDRSTDYALNEPEFELHESEAGSSRVGLPVVTRNYWLGETQIELQFLDISKVPLED